MFTSAYNFHAVRTIAPEYLTTNSYDFLVTVSDSPREKFQNEIEKRTGFSARIVMVETNVLTLKTGHSVATKLKVSAGPFNQPAPGNSPQLLRFPYHTIPDLIPWLQSSFDLPVVDQTGLTNRYDIVLDCQWHPTDREINRNILKSALSGQLGLELVPSHEPIEMLVVEKVK